MPGQLLIVDGHNTLLGIGRFASVHRENPAYARDLLLGWLSEFQATGDEAVLIVFDGRGAQRDIQDGDEGRAMVIYASGQESADAVIEQVACSQVRKRPVLVVTNDRLIRHAVEDKGAQTVSLATLDLQVETRLSQWKSHWKVQ